MQTHHEEMLARYSRSKKLKKPLGVTTEQLEKMKIYTFGINQDLRTKVEQLESHDGKKMYKCSICGLTKIAAARGKDIFRTHMTTHRPGNPFNCPEETCKYLGGYYQKLMRHIKDRHAKQKPRYEFKIAFEHI